MPDFGTFMNPEEVAEANRRHDQTQHQQSMDPAVRLRSTWRETITCGELTDRKIDTYIQQGFYSDEFRAKRREVAAKKAALRKKRQGNFEVRDGRLIYSPL